MTKAAEYDRTSAPRPGHGALEIQSVAGLSAATTVRSANPLKLLVPRPRGPSVWGFTSSFGGGLVAGDQTRLDLNLRASTRCFLGTQASTKVYRNQRAQPCGHTTAADIGPDALLVYTPDLVQAFADSIYEQRQDFHLQAGASLVLLDWFSAGRSARGERWQFRRFKSRNAIHRSRSTERIDETELAAASQPDLVFLDSILLEGADGALDGPHRTGRFDCFATLVMLGPAVASLAKAMLADIQARPVQRQSSLLVSASPIADGGLLRIAGTEVEAVAQEWRRHLTELPSMLGDDPWSRKW